MKLLETLSGTGEVFEENSSLGIVNYTINVYQEMIDNEEGMRQKLGRISADFVLIHKIFEGNNLHLVLEDSRKINFFLRNNDGNARFSGDFY